MALLVQNYGFNPNTDKGRVALADEWLAKSIKKDSLSNIVWQGERTDLKTDIVESLPTTGKPKVQATDKAGKMMGVSSRSVRDAKVVR